jgi:acetylornithine deacetylase/succinyl-diaminopimelate desuccinylase-like protein
MTGTRDGAIVRARMGFDDGSFIERLRALVAVPTESHPPRRKHELERYCRDVCGPMIEGLGFATQVFGSPDPIHGPVLIGTRIEDAALPTVLIYGHGDVVRAMPEAGGRTWTRGPSPSRATASTAAAWSTTRASTYSPSRPYARSRPNAAGSASMPRS